MKPLKNRYVFDWKSKEGKELVQKVFKRFISYHEWSTSRGQEVDQWRFVRTYCKERNKETQLIDNAIQWLIDCKILQRQPRYRAGRWVYDAIWITDFGRERWENRNKPKTSEAKTPEPKPAKTKLKGLVAKKTHERFTA